MKLEAPFIPLPLRFDVARLAHELALLESAQWRLHPDKTNGNSALPLISAGGGDNDDATGDMQPTPWLERSPYLRQVIASFNEVFGRSRFMRLAPGCEVSEHVDVHHHWFNRVRIHVPVVTNPGVIFHCGGEQRHMAAGECWIFDTWRLHRVVNGGQEQRTHLVIDTAGSSRFWEMAARAHEAVRNGTPLVPKFIPYVEGLQSTVRTERYGQQTVMSPGEVDHLVGDLIRDFTSRAGNSPALVATYARVLSGFCKDWRALWYQYGIQEAGWLHYDALLKATLAALPDTTPPLLLSNNDVEAKRAFLERVGYAAVVPRVHEQFVKGVAPMKAPAAATVAATPPPTPRPAATPGNAAAPATVRPAPAFDPNLSRNAPCPCGSGQRYKHCHGANL